MIVSMIAGRLLSAPELRRTKDGRTIVVASVKARIGRDNTEAWQVHAHERIAQAALRSCASGDFVSIQGVPSTRSASIKGEPVIQRILHAETVLPLKPEGGLDADALS